MEDEVTVRCGAIDPSYLIRKFDMVYGIPYQTAEAILSETCRAHHNCKRIKIFYRSKPNPINREGVKWAYDGLPRPKHFPQHNDWLIRAFFLNEISSSKVQVISIMQIDEGFQEELLKATTARIARLVACIQSDSRALAPLGSHVARYDRDPEAYIFDKYELDKLKKQLSRLIDITMLPSSPAPLTWLANMKLPVSVRDHCVVHIELSYNDGQLEVKFTSMPNQEGLEILFNEVVRMVFSSMKACLQSDPVKMDLCVLEIPCLHESDLLTKMIVKGLRDEKLIHVIKGDCKIVSPGELISSKRINWNEVIETDHVVSTEFLSHSLRSNVHLMNSHEWRKLAFVVKTETSLQVQLWKAISKNKVLAIRSDIDLSTLADAACERAKQFTRGGLQMSSLARPYPILSPTEVSYYEAAVFMNAIQNKLQDAGFTVTLCTSDPPSNKDWLTKEEIVMLQQGDYYAMHTYLCELSLQVSMFFQLTDAGKTVLWGDRHKKALAAHLAHPMATNLTNLEKNQRVYFNIGYRDIPIPPAVGVSDTCVVMERLKHEKKIFYKFQHISETVPADGKFTTVFLVHIKQVSQMTSMVQLPGSHRAHTAYRKENKYSEAGVAALSETE